MTARPMHPLVRLLDTQTDDTATVPWRKRNTAWERWEAGFRRILPELMVEVTPMEAQAAYALGREVGTELARNADRLPALPRNVGFRGFPHAARLVRWIAKQIPDNAASFRRGLNMIVLEQVAKTAF